MSEHRSRPTSLMPGTARPGEEAAASVDAGLVAFADEARRVDLALRALLAGDRRDTGEIPGLDDLADTLTALVNRICQERALGIAGVVAKANLSAYFGRYEGDRDARLALSVVRDLLALSGELQT